MRDNAWIVIGLMGLTVLMLFVSSSLSRAVAAEGEATISEALAATRAENPDWPWDVIDAGTLQRGMSEAMVLAALGTPDTTIEAEDSSGRHTRWIYAEEKYGSVWTRRRDGIDHRYKHPYEFVEFQDGAVTSWVE